MKKMLLITSLMFTQSISTVNCVKNVKNMTLEEIASAQPEQVNVVEILKARAALRKQESKAALLCDMPESVGITPKKEIIFEEAAPVTPQQTEPQEPIFVEDDCIAHISELEIDPLVKKKVLLMLANQKRQHQTQYEEMITNQRIMILLLSAIAAKLVIYDILMDQKESK